MDLAVVAGALGLLCLPGALGPWGRRLPPRLWARVCLSLLGAGVVGLEVTLLARSAPVVLTAAGATGWANVCRHAWAALAHGGPAEGWAAGATAVLIAARAAAGAVRRRRLRVRTRAESCVGRHLRLPGFELVELPAPEPAAMTVPGRPPQVVITAGLRVGLSQGGLDAVLAHEAAHVAHRHWRALALAALVSDSLGFLPPVQASVDRLHCAVERWADEEAATTPARRRELREVLERLALAEPALGTAPMAPAATVAERIAALGTAPASRSGALAAGVVVPGVVLGMATGAAALSWLQGMRGLLGALGMCPL